MIQMAHFTVIGLAEQLEPKEATLHTIERWLTNDDNRQRLQVECDKICTRYLQDQRYDVERAFVVLAKRLCSVAGA